MGDSYLLRVNICVQHDLSPFMKTKPMGKILPCHQPPAPTNKITFWPRDRCFGHLVGAIFWRSDVSLVVDRTRAGHDTCFTCIENALGIDLTAWPPPTASWPGPWVTLNHCQQQTIFIIADQKIWNLILHIYVTLLKIWNKTEYFYKYLNLAIYKYGHSVQNKEN